MSELKKTLQMQKCPKTFVHDWSHKTQTKRLKARVINSPRETTVKPASHV